MTAPVLDRLTRHVHTFILMGQSYRLRRSKMRSGVIADYVVYYNEQRRHGSLRNKSPKAFRALLDAGRIVARPFAA